MKDLLPIEDIDGLKSFTDMDPRHIIFGHIFLLANRLQTVMDQTQEELTSKQWFTITMLEMCNEPPTLNELAKLCDASHQNTKQIILKLEKKGFVKIEKDTQDRRAMRIILTDKIRQWDETHKEMTTAFVDTMFSDLSQEEMILLLKTQFKLYNRLKMMDPRTINK